MSYCSLHGVAYDSRFCPACKFFEAAQQITDKDKEIEDLKNEVSDLKAEIESLKALKAAANGGVSE